MTFKHGTVNGYSKHKCRCQRCRKAKREANRAYWARRGRAPMGNPCQTPDGRTFPSQAAAAMALGVSQQCISDNLSRNGTLDMVGIRRTGRNGGFKRPVRIQGREWPSRSALARYLGVSDYSVRDWLRRGAIDRLVGALMKADAKAVQATQMERAAA